MVQPFIGEIRMFGGNFAPVGWALCDGQLLQINQAEALFSLLGTIYGGDGRTTFGLPDLRGRIPIHKGQGPGLTNRNIGTRSGQEDVTLVASNHPAHTHNMRASSDGANSPNPADNVVAEALTTTPYLNQNPNANMNANAVGPSPGGGQAHNNVQPFLCLNFIIALIGLYPSRT